MRRVVCTEIGPPERLVVEEADDPVAAPKQIVVDVKAAGVSHVDGRIVIGRYPMILPTPFTPGHEFAGIVSAVGDGVDGLAVGDRVFAMAGMGAYASKLLLRAASVFRLPENLSLSQGATVLQSYSTALIALTRRTTVSAGEKVLVLGAGGGVGLASIDVARGLGAEVIAAASSADKLKAALDQGAAHAINYESDDLESRVLELSEAGVDVVVDTVGGRHREVALRLLGSGGRFLLVGTASADEGCIPPGDASLKNRTVVGVDGGDFGMRDRQGYGELLMEVAAMAADGRISPVTPAERPMSEAGSALRDILERRVTGKVVLVP